MAKKDGKKKRIPKKIGDVKIPKELRQAGEALLDKANSPAGREIIATGLTIAAAAAATALRKDHGQEGKSDPQRMADAVSGMADAVLDRIFGGKKA
ncbi:MAG: hypothetical protein QM688_10355 [Sphingomonas bacterium]